MDFAAELGGGLGGFFGVRGMVGRWVGVEKLGFFSRVFLGSWIKKF